MEVYYSFILFGLGLAVGSFLNVLICRYDPEKNLFAFSPLTGRSRCMHCDTELRWFELIPVISFFIQRGRCRKCNARISFQYPIVELLTALIFVYVPGGVGLAYPYFHVSPFEQVLWVVVFLLLLMIAVIDFRKTIIPDEATLVLAAIGAVIIVLHGQDFGITRGSFLGSYSLLFGWRENIFVNHALAAALAVLFFGILIVVTRGRGMGMGDLKLAGALGVVFGWPDAIIIVGVAFVLGSVVALAEILRRKKGMKSYLPFGPFLSAASAVVFFSGFSLLQWYFVLFSL